MQINMLHINLIFLIVLCKKNVDKVLLEKRDNGEKIIQKTKSISPLKMSYPLKNLSKKEVNSSSSSTRSSIKLQKK